MTREKAIEILKDELYSGSAGCVAEISQALEMAIKALEQGPILDKIRAEIEELDVKYLIGDYAIYGENIPKYVRLWDVIKIIDKYKAENKIEQGLDNADQDALMSAT